ncbi:Alpha/Beta hydrolase protein [Auriculariales sp. MPI-PUGE-AT-0066]|nr:Alpha/Beta hydrolase protein [Auriculariales sp. MPI-PUGE-AT-0066]
MFALSAIALALSAVPTALGAAIERRATTTLTAAQIAAYTPYTRFAGAAYCAPASTKAWTCGANCNALSGFVPTASGGDGASIQYWYVGYYPTLNTVIVGYQGTEASKVVPVLVDADYSLDPLNSTFFPGVSSSVQTHGGFGDAFDRSAAAVFTAVSSTLTAHSGATVTVVGHSLGAAIAQVAAVSLKMRLPSGTAVKYVGYSAPRVGNPAWANLVDSSVPDTHHINNKKDIVPIIPGRFLGFAHPSGEIHITSANQWLACTGQDSTETGCTIDTVPNILVGDAGDHSGPFNGIVTSCTGA